MEQQPKKKLGISKETQAKAGIPIPAPKKLDKASQVFPNAWEFPVAQLVKVHFDPAKDVTRNQETTQVPAIIFVFTTANGKQFTHVEFPIDEEDEDKFNTKFENLSQRLKHIFCETVGEDRFKEGVMEGDDFTEFFSNVAKAFNAEVYTKGEGEAAKTLPIYTRNHVYIKLGYYKDRLQIPMYPNFVQKAYNGTNAIACELMINPTYDKVEPQARASANAATQYGGGTNNSFGAVGDMAFPDIP
jgi:hypothetical protein